MLFYFCSQRCVLLSCDWYLIVYPFISHGSLHITCRSFINLYNLPARSLLLARTCYTIVAIRLWIYRFCCHIQSLKLCYIFITTCTTIMHRRVLRKVRTRGFKHCANLKLYFTRYLPTKMKSTVNAMCLFPSLHSDEPAGGFCWCWDTLPPARHP